MTLTKTEKIQNLQEFALTNYENGGHWIVECWGVEDYEELLDEEGNSLVRARREMKRCWKMWNERQKDATSEIF